MPTKSYQYMVVGPRIAYGDGSQHVGLQQDYSNEHQGEKEAIDVCAAPWLHAPTDQISSTFGKNTEKSKVDFIKGMGSEYVMSLLIGRNTHTFAELLSLCRATEKQEYGLKRSLGRTEYPST